MSTVEDAAPVAGHVCFEEVLFFVEKVTFSA